MLRKILLSFAAAVMMLLVSIMPAQASVRIYAALGDSFSTGQGLVGTQPTACLDNYQNSYAAYAAHRLDAQLTLVACSGATTTDVLNNQLSVLSPATTLVTVTGGGNDVNTIPFIGSCVGGDCAGQTGLAYLRSIWTEVGSKQQALYRAIAQRIGPHTKVRVLGYPSLMTLQLFGGADPVICPAFSPQERAVAAAATYAFDAVTNEAVASLGDPRFRYVSALPPPWLGHPLCGQQTPYLMGSVGPVPFHPTIDGHRAYAAQLLNSL